MGDDYSGLGTSEGFMFPKDKSKLPAGVPRPMRVYESSTSGPPVIVLHELFGLSHGNLNFGSRLAKAGFNSLTAGQYAACLRDGASLPPRPVVVTFDDGYADFALAAIPIMP